MGLGLNDVTQRIIVEDASRVGEVRRVAVSLCERLGFNEFDTGRAALVAVEAATNLHKHATQGEIMLTPCSRSHPPCLEIAAVDRGPGMENIERNFVDGFSSAGTPGTGLGAITRQSDRCDVFSHVGSGTAIWASVCRRRRDEKPQPERFDIGAVNIPIPGEVVSGDVWGAREEGSRQVILAADGLGHGPDAALASRVVVQNLHDFPFEGPAAFLRRCHESMHNTRGAAVAVAEIDPAAGELRFSGIGNVRCMVLGRPPVKGLASNNGTLGQTVRNVEEVSHAWEPGSLLVMATDGIVSGLDLLGIPRLASRSPGLVAAVLSLFFRRHTDDSLVLVARDRLEAS